MPAPRILLVGGIVLIAVVGGSSVARADDRPEPLDLARLEGVDKFPGDAEALARLARDGFVVLPRFHRQIFSPYIGGDLPYYVTADSAHHTYHVVFEQTLQEVERALSSKGRDLLRRLGARVAVSAPSTPFLRDEAWALLRAHLEVPLRLLGEPPTPGLAWEDRIAEEVALLRKAAGTVPSPLSAEPEDYGFYLPRGPYADSPDLAAWFRAATWLGRRGLRVADRRETAAAVLLLRAFREDPSLAADLEAGDAALRAFVGPADDLTVAEYRAALDPILGADASDATLEASLPRIQATLAALRDPEINGAILPPEAWRAFRTRTKGLRLLPARRTPDGWLFQALAEADPMRSLPSGLEVAQALGSARAAVHLAAQGETGSRAAAHVRERSPEFRSRLAETHYGASLGAAALLLDGSSPLLGAAEAPAGAAGTPVLPAPLFRTPAWHDRLLATGLSVWTATRHAWVLHAKTTVHYLGLTQDPAGVVEPEPRFYRALADLARDASQRAQGLQAFRRDPKVALAALLPLLEALSRDGTLPEDEFAQLLAYEAALVRIFPDDLEPQAERFREIVQRLRSWLEGKGALEESLAQGIARLGESDTASYLEALRRLLDRLAGIAERELRGEALSEADEEFVREYGKTIAGLHFFGGNSWLSPDRTMGFVASVGSDPQRGLHRQVAVGAALELYVALPIRGGGHRLYLGGVYAPYEFDETAPLTDDEWRERVEARSLPPPPPWTSSYVAWASPSDLAAEIAAGGMPDAIESLSSEVVGRALLSALVQAPAGSETGRERLRWLLEHLAPYGTGPLREEVVLACLDVLRHRLGEDEEGDVAEAAAGTLAAASRPADVPRLVTLLQSPPVGAPEAYREGIVAALLQMATPPSPEAIVPLLADAEPGTRLHGVRLLAEPLLPGGAATPEESRRRVDLLVTRLHGETDAGVAEAILDGLFDAIPVPDAAHAVAIAPRLASPEAPLRARAAGLLGRLGSERHAADLLGLLSDADEDVAAAAARAAGQAVGVRGTDAPLRAQVRTALEALFPTRGWLVAVACIEGLAALGDAEAAAALARIASNATVDPGLKSVAVEALADTGEPAVPHLFRLLFDETETGDSTNRHRVRVCDLAARRLDEILYGRFGWPAFGVPEPQDLERVLGAMRDEARRLGHRK